MKAKGGTERARSGDNCGGRTAGSPDAPWSGPCGSKDCERSREDERRPRSPTRPGHAPKTRSAAGSRPTPSTRPSANGVRRFDPPLGPRHAATLHPIRRAARRSRKRRGQLRQCLGRNRQRTVQDGSRQASRPVENQRPALEWETMKWVH